MNCYIHVPFCLSKCGYCAFFSEVCHDREIHRQYLDHLDKQLKSAALPIFDTLYVGGGTPSAFDLPEMQQFLDILQHSLKFSPGAERSIEANPETLTPEKVDLLRRYFTRISIGIQSFDVQLRSNIGRQCSEAALKNALDLIRTAEFPHWNVDLIYSLPGQNTGMWERDLRTAASCGADHISCYSLTPEHDAVMGDAFAEDDEQEAVMFDMAERILREYNIERYEISNYAHPGCECRHNLNVWQGQKLYGFGPSAADFDGKVRHIEPASLELWLQNAAPETDVIPWTERLNEIFAVNLRTVAGWHKEMWERIPGADLWENRLGMAEKLQKIYPGALNISPERIKLSGTGLLYWNDIAQEIL